MVDNFDEVPSLRELLVAAAASDERGIGELHRRYNKTVCHFVHFHLKQKGCNDFAGHSEDILNRAWFAIIMHGYQLKDEGRMKPWINTTVSRLVSDHVSGLKGCISQQKKTVQLDPTRDAEIRDTRNTIEASIWVDEMVTLAYEMSFMFGEIVRLHLVEGYKLEKVAEELGQSYGTVRNFYYRNLKNFRKFFNDNIDDDNDDSEDDESGDVDDNDSPYEN